MKRIAFFIDTFAIGGAETVVLNLCKALAQHTNHQPIIIHFNAQAIQTKCEQLGLEQISAPGYRFYKKTITLPLFALIFAKFLRQQQIHVLHSHLYGPIVASAPAAWLTNIRHIGTLHDTYTIAERPSRIHLLKFAALLKTNLVTVSSQMEGYYRQTGQFSKNTLHTIYNGVEIKDATHTSNKNLRQALHINPNEIIIICVARLVKLKRHGILINAFNQIKNNQNTRLLIVGDGPERTKLEALASKLQSKEQIIFLGERQDVNELLNIADIFALTSETEGLSCSILEAMAAGLPIIASNVGGNFELVKNDINGFLVNADTPNDVSKKMESLLDNTELRKAFGKKSSNISKAQFNWDSTFAQYTKLYEH